MVYQVPLVMGPVMRDYSPSQRLVCRLFVGASTCQRCDVGWGGGGDGDGAMGVFRKSCCGPSKTAPAAVGGLEAVLDGREGLF